MRSGWDRIGKGDASRSAVCNSDVLIGRQSMMVMS